MKKADIERDYTVVDGVIRSPGKFEGKPVYAPALYELVMDGVTETLMWSDESISDILEIEDNFRTEFGIPTSIVALSCWEADTGFFNTEQLDEDGLSALWARYADDQESVEEETP